MSDIRKKYAEKLVIAVTEALKDLNFLDVVFEMRFDVLSNYTTNGYDDAEFMISTNPGGRYARLERWHPGENFQELCLR